MSKIVNYMNYFCHPFSSFHCAQHPPPPLFFQDRCRRQRDYPCSCLVAVKTGVHPSNGLALSARRHWHLILPATLTLTNMQQL
jgi:hypothetical protein